MSGSTGGLQGVGLVVVKRWQLERRYWRRVGFGGCNGVGGAGGIVGAGGIWGIEFGPY